MMRYPSLFILALLSLSSSRAQSNEPENIAQSTGLEKEVEEYQKSSQTLSSSLEKSTNYTEIKQAIKLLDKDFEDVEGLMEKEYNEKTFQLGVDSYPYALLVDAGYHFPIEEVSGFRRLKKSEIPELWQARFIDKTEDKNYPNGKGMLLNDHTESLWAAVFENTSNKSLVLVLRGAELRPQNVKDFTKNATTVAIHWMGKEVPRHFIKALELGKALQEKYPDRNLIVTGSSLGGALSQFVGLSLDTKVYAFNSLGLSPAEIKMITEARPGAFDDVEDEITLITISGDSVSDTSAMLPKSWVNPYFGTVVSIPFYDTSFSGYYGSVHHTSDAIVQSMEVYIKPKIAKYQQKNDTKEDHAYLDKLMEDGGDNNVVLVNQSPFEVTVVAYPCTTSSFFGLNNTSCDQSMFQYPHALGFMSTVRKAQKSIPLVSLVFDVGLDKPFIKRILPPGKNSHSYITLPKPKVMSWPANDFTKNRWVYITAYSERSTCKSGQKEPFKYIGKPFYEGVWPSTFKTGKTPGWMLPEGSGNPKLITISQAKEDACGFLLKGYTK